jgi:putative ABC transport system ATP-binding protein
MAAFIECRRLLRVYDIEGQAVTALRSIDLQLDQGELVAIVGASGSGKSTLLHAIGGLDRPTAGDVLIDGRSLSTMDDAALAGLRNRTIGFVFQQFNLLPRHDAVRNVELPLVYAGWPRARRRARALELLTQLGLASHTAKRPSQMSGGQQQRVAIARALAHEPRLVLADEPTGALDSSTGAEVMRLLLGLNRERGITVAIVTHETAIAAQCDRVLTFTDGRLVSDRRHRRP